MKKFFAILLAALIIFTYYCFDSNAGSTILQASSTDKYNFVAAYDAKQSIENRIPVPAAFKRAELKPGSFAAWLRHLPLKRGKPDVYLYNGELKADQDVHYAVLDIDVGKSDLQQCADAVMRMRAEYLYSKSDYENLHFNFTSGHTISYKKWTEGYRPQIKGNNVSWVKNAPKSDTYAGFKNYLQTIFSYAGTASLSKELKPVASLSDIRGGDVFIVGGFPGHAVLVVDVCENAATHEKLFMIQQSYMPAQDIHILNNYNNSTFSPWYSINFAGDLQTPQWTFKKSQLMRFSSAL